MTYETIASEFGPVIAACAADYGRKYHRYGAETDDFLQEFQTWCWENEALLDEKREEFDDDDRFTRWLARCLRNQGLDYGVDIRAQAGQQDRASAYWYNKGEVEALLPLMFNPQSWHEPPQSEGRSAKAPAEGGNWIATLADVAQAFEKLPVPEQVLLRERHQFGVTNGAQAEARKITAATMSYRHGRAIKLLWGILGGPKPHPMREHVKDDPWRGRRAISSAHARALQSNYYEEA